MSLREAAQQALEALEKVTRELLAVRDELAERGGRPTTNVFHQRLWDSSFDAYTNHAMPVAEALRTALAEPEQEFVCSTGLCRYRKPLTDEEIELLAVKHAPPTDPAFAEHDDFIEFARAIERAHGIGGEA
jgi:hypothetical protein